MRPFRIALLALHAAADPPCWSHELVRSADFGPPAAAAAAPRFFAMHKGGWRDDSAARAPRPYDERCGIMKARYNLQADERSPRADEWSWRPLRDENPECRVELPSPAQLADLSLGQVHRQDPRDHSSSLTEFLLRDVALDQRHEAPEAVCVNQ